MTQPDEVTPDERVVVFERWWNVRELGGVKLGDGCVTKTGVAWRAASAQWASENDIKRIKSTPVSMLIDLRAQEAVRLENVVPTKTVDILGNVKRNPEWEAPKMLCTILEQAGPELAAAARAVVDASSRGVAVYHCHTGKDRTGLLSMLLLGAVGVDRQTLLDDFMASQNQVELMKNMLDKDGISLWAPTTPAYVKKPLSEEAGNAALDLIYETGGPSAYLHKHGMTEHELDAWATKLTGDR